MLEKIKTALMRWMETDEDMQPEQIETRRQHERRTADMCVVVIGENTHPVQDWSFGGILVTGDARQFGIGDQTDLELKFKLRDTIMSIPQKGHVVRKGTDKIAFRFDSLDDTTLQHFRHVVDDYAASSFAGSQA